MPTYVYRFLDCDGTIDVQQSFADDALTEALNPADGQMHPVKKVFTPVGVSFKGNGFYKTDSRGKSGSSSSESSTKTETKSDSGSSSSPPTTPASTPAAPASSGSSANGASSSHTHSHGSSSDKH